MSSVVFAALFTLTRIADFDLYIHLRLGQWLVENRAFYYTDQFTFSSFGYPQYLGYWLSAAVIYLAFKAGGYVGLAALKSVLFTSITYVLYRAMRREGGGLVPAVVALLVFAFAIRFRLDLRPYYFTYLFLSVFLSGLLGYRRSGKVPWWLIPCATVWSNAHGAFIIGTALTGLFFLTESVSRRKPQAGLLILTICVFAASCLNLEGTYEYGKLLGSGQGSGPPPALLGEWQSMTKGLLWGFGLKYTFGFQLLVLGSFAYLIILASRRKFDLFYTVVFLGSVIYPIKHVRLIEISAILLAPLFHGFAREVFSLVRSDRYRRMSEVAVSLALALLLVFTVILSDTYSFGIGPKKGAFPEEAVRFLEQNDIGGRGFNTVTAGSYMLWRTPERKVFIDGRLVPKAEVQSGYEAAIDNSAGLEKLDAEFGFNYAILDYDQKMKWRFPSHLNNEPGWSLVYWDTSGLVYLKRAPENSGIIEKNGYRILRPYFNDFRYLDHYFNRPGFLEDVEHDMSLNPENQEALLAGAYVYYYLGMKEKAAEAISRALDIGPDTSFEHTAMAMLLIEKGEKGKARGHLKRALSIDPGNGDAKTLLEGLK